jgi:hypothetical protein
MALPDCREKACLVTRIEPLSGWQKYDSSSLDGLVAYLTPEERKLFAWMAENHYTAAGEIVDAGSFLGGSAACFAHGLAGNDRVAVKDGRIHGYDIFRFAPWIRNVEALAGFTNGQSFLNVAHDQLADFDRHVTLYPGDITKRTWRGGPIELLMLDCSKTAATNEHCMRMFFPALQPDVSYVLHQDYAIVSRLHWIHSSMYLLREHFAYCGNVERGGTVVFKCVKQIEQADVEAAIGQQRAADIMTLANEVAEYMDALSARCGLMVRESAKAFLENPF